MWPWLTALLLVLLAHRADAHVDTAGPVEALGTVAGRALDEAGGVLPGVTVHVRTSTSEHTTSTDDTGSYRIEEIPVGPASMTFTLSNFAAVDHVLTVSPGRLVALDAVLRLALTADVIVRGRPPVRDIEDGSPIATRAADTASQGTLTGAQLAARPVMRAGDVLEAVPGLAVSQHSGEGKANQYYLRGFNLDHGTDFSTTVAGVPVNAPTGAHSHGYADANFLIPELIDSLHFKKGPYFADEGDFSAAGAATISYRDTLDRPLASFSSGADGWRRTLLAASPRAAQGHLLGAVEYVQNDGPWVRGDHLRKGNGVLRYSRGDRRNGLAVTGMGHWADWDSTDQVPSRAVQAGLISRFGAVDPTDRGHTDRQSLAVRVQRSQATGATQATGFVLRSGLSLLSNFTYFLDDPVNGDQFEQSERRVAVGGQISHRRTTGLFGRHVENELGVQLRRDAINPVGLYRTVGGARTTATRVDRVGQTLIGAYAQNQVQWLSALRTTAGLRADVYQYDVTSNLTANSGRGATAMASPKFSAAFGPWAGTEFYANAGLGFHSNDARGATTRVDPATHDAVMPVTPLVRARGAEIGLRTVERGGAQPGRVQSTLALWCLGLDSELRFVGDAGTTESGRASRRTGVEWSTSARLRPWLRLDLDMSLSRARFAAAVADSGDGGASGGSDRDVDSAHNVANDVLGPHIPGTLARVVSAGLTAEPSRRLSASLRVRHLGPRPLTEDAGMTSRGSTLWNADGGVRLSPRARVVVEGFNLSDVAVSDVEYVYRSRLPGEPRDGIEDVHSHAVPPRSLRVGLDITF